MIPKRSLKPADPHPHTQCPAEHTLRVIAGKWKVPIVWHLMPGTRRFSELRKCLPVITPRMLTRQLRELEADGLLVRRIYAEIPPRVEYTLTSRGRTLNAIITEMCKWSGAAGSEPSPKKK
jgi:DNA-binding HxlR family transcriptional regulator